MLPGGCGCDPAPPPAAPPGCAVSPCEQLKNHTNRCAASLHSASHDAALQVPAALWGKLPRMPNTSSPPSAAAPASLIDSRQAAWRLLTTLGLVVLGNSSMYVVSVVLPAVQAEFCVGRADASLPYTLMMVCLGLGGIWTGRMADRHGLMPVLCVGAVAVCGGFVWAGLSGSIWGFGLAHGLMGLIGSSATFAPLMAGTALWWNKRRGIAVAICASGNYIAGALWPPIVQHGIELIG